MGQLLCEAPSCRARGRHWSQCSDEDCRGCQPRTAADGVRLCALDVERIAEHAAAAARLHDELALALQGTDRPGERTTGGQAAGLALNERAIDARSAIRAVLAAWCRLIADERGVTLPTDAVSTMGAYVARHAAWLAAHPAAGDCAEELRELARGEPYRVAHPTGARVLEVGPCPDCAGTLRAILRTTDALLPSAVQCDLDDEHTWSADRWHALGRTLRGRAA